MRNVITRLHIRTISLHISSPYIWGKKYPCDECDFQATQKSNLTKHHQSVHMGKKYPCGECCYQATETGSLNQHMLAIHMGKKYPCGECDYQASSKSNITAHQQSVHMGKKDSCGNVISGNTESQQTSAVSTHGKEIPMEFGYQTTDNGSLNKTMQSIHIG